jgi:hypothetical protein
VITASDQSRLIEDSDGKAMHAARKPGVGCDRAYHATNGAGGAMGDIRFDAHGHLTFGQVLLHEPRRRNFHEFNHA